MRIQKGLANLHSFSVTNAVKNRLGDKAWLNFVGSKECHSCHLEVSGHHTGWPAAPGPSKPQSFLAVFRSYKILYDQKSI